MANYVNTHGVTCAITDHQGFYGVRDGYSVTMTGPDGVPLYTGVIHPAILAVQPMAMCCLDRRRLPVPHLRGERILFPPAFTQLLT